MTRMRRLIEHVERPPSDASRRPLAPVANPARVFDRIAADRRRTGFPSGLQGDRSPVRSKGPSCRRPGRLVALGVNPRPPSRASVLRRRLIYRERLAPTGNRAIPTDRILWLSKLFQGVIDRRKGSRHPGFRAWADANHSKRFMRFCQEQYKNIIVGETEQPLTLSPSLEG